MRRTTLEDEYNWYIAQANSPENTPAQRLLWQQLAEELAPRVAVPDPDTEQLW